MKAVTACNKQISELTGNQLFCGCVFLVIPPRVAGLIEILSLLGFSKYSVFTCLLRGICDLPALRQSCQLQYPLFMLHNQFQQP